MTEPEPLTGLAAWNPEAVRAHREANKPPEPRKPTPRAMKIVAAIVYVLVILWLAACTVGFVALAMNYYHAAHS